MGALEMAALFRARGNSHLPLLAPDPRRDAFPSGRTWK